MPLVALFACGALPSYEKTKIKQCDGWHPARRSEKRIPVSRLPESPRRAGETDPRSGTLQQDLVAKPEKLGRAAPGLAVTPSGPFDQSSVLDQAAKILFVKADPRKGLHRPLQLEQSEGLVHELEYHRTISNLGSDTTDCGSEYPAVVEGHLETGVFFEEGSLKLLPLVRAIADRLRGETELVEKLVPFKHPLSVPRTLGKAKSDARSDAAQP